MALITKIRNGQYPLIVEKTINFNDTVTNLSSVVEDLSAVATHDFDLMDTPPGFSLVGGDVVVDTAWATSTVATVSLGDSGSATRYASAVDLKTAARTALTVTGLEQASNATIRARVNITVAAATAGVARLRLMYVIDNRANENV